MANLSYGSQGSEVKKLQELLNNQGYGLDTDGIFGNKTQSAVRDYQTKNNLKVDGIVGTQTMGSLTGGTAAAPKVATPAVPKAVTPVRPTYTPSNALNTANQAVTNWEKAKPGAYTSSYESQIDALLEKVLNGEKFSYDVNADALYQQYKDQYTKLGQRAMQDTMGQAAALTGGYGSSYGVTAGSQAYQQYLSELNNVVPELHEAAYQKYMSERNALRDNLSTLQTQDSIDYSKYRDTVGDYWTEGNYLSGKSQQISDDEYQKYLQLAAEYESDRGYDFSQEQFDYQKAQDLISQQNWEKEYNLAKQAAAKSSTGKTSSKYSDKELMNMFDGGNPGAVISTLEEEYGKETGDILNKMTAIGIPYDEAFAALEKHWGASDTETDHEKIIKYGSYIRGK